MCSSDLPGQDSIEVLAYIAIGGIILHIFIEAWCEISDFYYTHFYNEEDLEE